MRSCILTSCGSRISHCGDADPLGGGGALTSGADTFRQKRTFVKTEELGPVRGASDAPTGSANVHSGERITVVVGKHFCRTLCFILYWCKVKVRNKVLSALWTCLLIMLCQNVVNDFFRILASLCIH